MRDEEIRAPHDWGYAPQVVVATRCVARAVRTKERPHKRTQEQTGRS